MTWESAFFQIWICEAIAVHWRPCAEGQKALKVNLKVFTFSGKVGKRLPKLQSQTHKGQFVKNLFFFVVKLWLANLRFVYFLSFDFVYSNSLSHKTIVQFGWLRGRVDVGERKVREASSDKSWSMRAAWRGGMCPASTDWKKVFMMSKVWSCCDKSI